MLAQGIDGLLVIANQVRGDMTGIVGAKNRKPRHLHGDHLPVDLHLRRRAGREDQVADLFGSAQHSPQQSRSRYPAVSREIFKSNGDRSNCWCCHSSSHTRIAHTTDWKRADESTVPRAGSLAKAIKSIVLRNQGEKKGATRRRPKFIYKLLHRKDITSWAAS